MQIDKTPHTQDTPLSPPTLDRHATLRAMRWLLLLLIPGIVVPVVLVVTGHLSVMTGLLAFAGYAVLMAMTAGRTLVDLSHLFAYVRSQSQGKPGAPPEIHSSGAAAAAALALAQIRRDTRNTVRAAADAVQSQEGVFDALPDAVIILDASRRVVRANAAARGLFGKKLLGRDVYNLVRHPPIIEALDMPDLVTKELDYTVPVPVERRFSVTIQAMDENVSGDAAILMSFHDVTTIRRLEQMRADFVANASHELRTPLSSLIGFIDTLRGPAQDDTEARERFLGIMSEQANRMARLIEDLLSLSRIELNEHTQPSKAVDVRRILTSVIEGLEPKANERKVSVTVKAPDTLPQVFGADEELTQVFQNLIENALKYTREGTGVQISVAALGQGPVSMPRISQGPVVAVAIRDHGDGIAQDHIPRLTERFYRVDFARSRQMGGTGLGLAIVKHVMNRHRGVLTIDSTIGAGSVFTVYIPVVREETSPTLETTPHPAIRADH